MLKSSKLRGFIKNMDFVLAALTLLAALFGILVISSAGGENGGRYVMVQSGALILGIAVVCVMMFLDYEYLAGVSFYLSAAALLLLVLVLIPGIGKVQGGARSWFMLGSLGFQPAEIAKIVFIILYAKLLSDCDGDKLNRPVNVARLVLCAAVPTALILMQPDFGTGAVFMFTAAVMLFVAGIGRRYIIGGIAGVAALCPIMWFFVLHDYQKTRIISVFNPESDPGGAGYQVIQSKLAIGSGRIFGSGLYRGAGQVNNSLPERHTDFIFSVVCEELGMVGALLVIILMCAIIIRCIYIGMNARNRLGTYMCMGVAGMLIFQTFENIGMCVGIFPVTGITLPFFSYGGSSLLTTMMAVGIVMSVKYKSRLINFL